MASMGRRGIILETVSHLIHLQLPMQEGKECGVHEKHDHKSVMYSTRA